MRRIRVSLSFLAFVLLVASIYLGSTNVEAQLRTGFYLGTCPRAELIVSGVVSRAVRANKRTGAGLIRLMFHDCFAKGCDASLLIDGPNSEKTAVPNLSVHGYDVIDSAKAAVEAVCPGKVSCADIVVMAARDSFATLGGGIFAIKTGRKDGTTSLASNTGDIPSPFAQADVLISNFARKGLSKDQMVALSGAHTVGKAQCATITGRLYPTVDPTLDPTYAAQLKNTCPQGGVSSVVNNLDVQTPEFWDNRYFTNLQQNKGLLISDQTLFTSASTRDTVTAFARNPIFFRSQFISAFTAMSQIEVLTGAAGQIRQNCRVVNA